MNSVGGPLNNGIVHKTNAMDSHHETEKTRLIAPTRTADVNQNPSTNSSIFSLHSIAKPFRILIASLSSLGSLIYALLFTRSQYEDLSRDSNHRQPNTLHSHSEAEIAETKVVSPILFSQTSGSEAPPIHTLLNHVSADLAKICESRAITSEYFYDEQGNKVDSLPRNLISNKTIETSLHQFSFKQNLKKGELYASGERLPLEQQDLSALRNELKKYEKALSEKLRRENRELKGAKIDGHGGETCYLVFYHAPKLNNTTSP